MFPSRSTTTSGWERSTIPNPACSASSQPRQPHRPHLQAGGLEFHASGKAQARQWMGQFATSEHRVSLSPLAH